MRPNSFNIAPIITKYLRNELTSEEEKILQQWLGEKESNRELLESFRDTKSIQKELEFIDSLDVDAAWIRAKERRKGAVIKRLIRYISYAAAIVLLIMGWLLWRAPQKSYRVVKNIEKFRNDVLPGSNKAELLLSDGRRITLNEVVNHLKEQDGTEITGKSGGVSYDNKVSGSEKIIFNTLLVPKAGTYQITLPDGTRVWINALSQLKFPVRFAGKERKVYLQGEAYFEVAKDASKPFRVEINGAEIEVLGTHFNVNAYTSATSTTLLEGAVKVISNKETQILNPGQQAVVSQNGILIGQADIDKAIAWKKGDFYFKSDRITDIMQQLARWYDLTIEYEGKIPNKRYSGSISRNVNLSEVLEMLQFVSKAHFEIGQHKVSVSFNVPEKP